MTIIYLTNSEDTNLEFGKWSDNEETYPKSCKIRSTGDRIRVTWPTFEFWDPLYIYKTAEDTNFKCGVWIDDEKSYPKHRKLWLTGTEPESRNLQRIQNAVASAVTQASWRSGARELRRELHWLPIRQRV